MKKKEEIEIMIMFRLIEAWLECGIIFMWLLWRDYPCG